MLVGAKLFQNLLSNAIWLEASSAATPAANERERPLAPLDEVAYAIAMHSWGRSALFFAAGGACLVHCAPNSYTLSADDTPTAQGGDAPSAGDSRAGQSGAGSAATGGAPATGGRTSTSAGPGSTNDDGGAPSAGAAGAAGETAAGAENGGDTNAGAGGQPGCVTPHAGQLGYDDFDTDLFGKLFPAPVQPNWSQETYDYVNASWHWDTSAGQTCPGALHFSVLYKGYPSATVEAPGYLVLTYVDFPFADWSGAKALHLALKVSANAPLKDVRLFLASGDYYTVYSMTGDTDFKTGAWHELVFGFADSGLDLSKMRRMGVMLTPERAGTAGIPAEPPPIDLLLDDAWLEAK